MTRRARPVGAAVPSTAPAPPRRAPSRKPRGTTGLIDRQQRRFGLIVLMPALLLIFTFFLLPMAYTFWISLHDWPLMGATEFVGLDNYAYALKDPDYRNSLVFTLQFAVVTTALTVVLSFLLALLVWQNFRFASWFRSAYFLPVAVGMAAAGYLWFNLFDPRVGMFDHVLQQLGIIDQPLNWLAHETPAFWALVITTVWKSCGFGMVIFVVGMQSVPTELRESFEADGASRLQTARFLVIPLLRRTTALVLVFTVLNTTLAFDQFFAMTRGGPGDSMVSAVYSIYNNAFIYQDLGYGSALATILLLVLTFVSALQLRLLRSEK